MRARQRVGVGVALLYAASAGCSLILGIEDVTPRGAGGSAGVGGVNGCTGGAASSATGGGAAASTGTGGMVGTGGTGGMGTGGAGTGATGPITAHQLTYQVGLTDQILDDSPSNFQNGMNVPMVWSFDGTNFSSFFSPSGDANGNFGFQGVPDGPYLLDFGGSSYWLTNRHLVSFDTYTTAVLHSMPLMDQPQIQLDLTNMTTWQAGDVLELVDPQTGAYAYDTDPTTFGWTVGAQAINGTADWLTFVGNNDIPVQPSDTVSIFHTGLRSAHTYETLLDYTTVTFSTPNADGGMPTFPVSGTFMPYSSGVTYQLNVDVPSFEALAVTSNPNATHVSTGIDYQVHPAPLDHGQLIGTADLAFEKLAAGSPAFNKTYVFGNPFAGWTMFVSISTQAKLSVTYPTKNALMLTGHRVTAPISCFFKPDDPILDAAKPFAPPDTPATAPTLDGASLYSSTSGPITTSANTPLIGWTPSATPHQAWLVEILELGNDAMGNTTLTGAEFVATDGSATSLRIPPGYLMPGHFYLFGILGISHSTLDYQHTPGLLPNLFPWPSCLVATVSDVVSIL